MAQFELAIDRLLLKEGKNLTNTTGDRGGLTKFGISQKAYPRLDIAILTEREAKEIYKRDFWDLMQLDRIEDQKVASTFFEFGVNFGVNTTIRMFQRLVDVDDDGKVGEVTIKAVNDFNDKLLLIVGFKLMGVDRYRLICNKDRSQTKFLLGWLNRIFE